MNIDELFHERALADPGRAAIITSRGDVDVRRSYGWLDSVGARIASVLHRSGIRSGDAVLVFVPMSAELYAVLAAVWQLGAVAMFLDPSAGREHIDRCCGLVRPEAFVGTRAAQVLRLESGPLRRIPKQFTVGGRLPGVADLIGEAESAPELTHRETADDTTPALITFTSGSTGLPKAAVRTHGFLLAQHAVLAKHLDLQPGQVDLTTLPVFAVANLASGVTSVIPDADLTRPGSIKPGPVVRQIDRLGVERTTASPALVERLVEQCESDGTTLDSLRRVHAGGAAVFPDLLDRLARVAPHAGVTAVYGSTEAEPIASIDLEDLTGLDRAHMLDGWGLLAGTPLTETRTRSIIADWGVPIGALSAAEFDVLCAPTMVHGEIVVTGEHVLKGYLDGHGDEETKFEVDGERWHRTGDAGFFDESGRLWLLGRTGAKIVDAKGELWPFSVECAAAGFPGVRRTALAARHGQRILVVEPRTHARPELDALSELLCWALLDDVHVTRRIPVDRRHNAKVDYPALAKLLDRELR
jgi:olefin beta-lactone synthetase